MNRIVTRRRWLTLVCCICAAVVLSAPSAARADNEPISQLILDTIAGKIAPRLLPGDSGRDPAAEAKARDELLASDEMQQALVFMEAYTDAQTELDKSQIDAFYEKLGAMSAAELRWWMRKVNAAFAEANTLAAASERTRDLKLTYQERLLNRQQALHQPSRAAVFGTRGAYFRNVRANYPRRFPSFFGRGYGSRFGRW